MTQPSLSIVTPCLNGARFLDETMRSVLDQIYPALEYGIQDGGSTDGSLEIVRAHAPRLSWWSSEPDGGLYDALNKGFARSRCEIMGYLNADDKYLPWTFAVVAEIFEQFPQIEWLTSLYPLAWDASGRAVRCSKREAFSGAEYLRGGYLAGASRPGAHWLQQESTFWRRSLWERAGGFDTSLKLAGDFDLWGRFFKTAELYAVDTPLAGFRRHGDQLSLGAGVEAYAAEALACLARHGGRPRGRMGALAALALRRVCPRRYWPWSGPVCGYDWKTGGWRIGRG